MGDVRDYARREQGRFFRGGRYDPHEAASMIALEAMLGGAEDVRISVVRGWICVCADTDWLRGIAAEAFSGFPPFPPGGPNGVTSEFFPVVFSASVATATRSGVQLVKGDSAGPVGEVAGAWERVVAFEVGTGR